MNRKEKIAEFINEGYTISVTGRHVLVTDAMKDYIIDKLSKMERYSSRILEVVVTMDIQKLDHRVDITAKVNHLSIRSSAISDDMYVSIDQAVDKLEKQFLKYKDKLQDHQHRALSYVDMNVNVLQPLRDGDIFEINEEIENENKRHMEEKYKPHRIVAQESRPLKTLSYDEAVVKMELSGDSFLLFRCVEDNQIKVIYRRSDNNYGIQEPENVHAKQTG
ncbi:MAG: ribosome-associated translation inhibitor RaiA [Parachlamydiales bacterium]|jgi:putative sigma-54 modulation protein